MASRMDPVPDASTPILTVGRGSTGVPTSALTAARYQRVALRRGPTGPPRALQATRARSTAAASSPGKDRSDVAQPGLPPGMVPTSLGLPCPGNAPRAWTYRHRSGVTEGGLKIFLPILTGPRPGGRPSGSQPVSRATGSQRPSNPGRIATSGGGLRHRIPTRPVEGLRLGDHDHPHAGSLGRDGPVERVLHGQAAGGRHPQFRCRGEVRTRGGACPGAPTRTSTGPRPPPRCPADRWRRR